MKLVSSLDIAKKEKRLHKNVIRNIRRLVDDYGLFVKEELYETGYNNCKRVHLILDEHVYNIYRDKSARPQHRLKELASIKTIEQILNVKLIKQYKCGPYKIDGYDVKNNIAYEIDEYHHTETVTEDLEKEEFIKSRLKCSFIRIKV